MAEKTMNTLLHVFEAYTELFRVTRKHSDNGYGGLGSRLAGRLRFMLNIFEGKIYNPELRRQEVFFDREYNSLIDLHSYGHDIESSWLIDRGLEALDDEDFAARIAPITKALAERIYERAYVNHSLLNECEKGVDMAWAFLKSTNHWLCDPVWLMTRSRISLIPRFSHSEASSFKSSIVPKSESTV